jgi:hypothetical protein
VLRAAVVGDGAHQAGTPNSHDIDDSEVVVVGVAGSGYPEDREGAGASEPPDDWIVVILLMMTVTNVVSLLLTALGIVIRVTQVTGVFPESSVS